MHSKSLITFALLLAAVIAAPKNSKQETSSSSSLDDLGSTSTSTTNVTTTTAISTADLTTTVTSTSTMTMTSTFIHSSSSPASSSPSRRDFVNHCQNLGVSNSDCARLANIATGKANKININGGRGSGKSSSSGSSSNDTDSGEEFLNQCLDFGVSDLNCVQLLNFAVVDGDSININIWVGSLPFLYSSPGVLPAGADLVRL